MRLADITPGQDYAWALRRGSAPDAWVRVTVDSLPSRGMRGARIAVTVHRVTGGERMEYDTSVRVAPQSLVAPWADVERLKAEHAAAKERELQARHEYLTRRHAEAVEQARARNAAHADLCALVPDNALPCWAQSDAEPAEARGETVWGLDAPYSSVTVVDLLAVAEGALTAAGVKVIGAPQTS
jgi:poly(3-hydroxybutyrate) depolymerase